MVAQVAADEPDTAAKMAQPITLMCSKRPGKRLSHGASPRNMPSAKRERNKISPIHKNSGSAVSVQLVTLPQMVSTMASPTGRSVNNCMATNATPSKDRPNHRPEPSTASNNIKASAIKASTAAPYSTRAGSPALVILKKSWPLKWHTKASTQASASPAAPTAMPIWGSHSGVASMVWATSCVV